MGMFWRFASGLHLDGQPRMNVSWSRNGTVPKHKDNWWNRKSRFRKMGWRWGIVGALALEIAFLVVFLVPALIVTGAIMLYLTEKALRAVRRQLFGVRPVTVTPVRSPREREIVDNIGAVEYDPESIPEVIPVVSPPPVENKTRGASVINDNPFITVRPIRKDEAG